MINEAFDTKRREFGEVKFSETSLDDPHVKKIIDAVVAHSGVKKEDIVKDIEEKLKKFDSIAKKSPILYETIQKNAIEQEIFDLLDKHEIAKAAPRFSLAIFTKLMRFIKVEHDQFFPLRNFIDHKYLYNPVIILVPSNKPEHKQFNDVDTAAATPSGQFIFCKPFMQKLIDYAHLKGVVPKGKKYKSNGGEIPDEYAYIEFLIIHEFMHYTYADFHYQKKYKASGKIINWVGDFRTNYLLVKSGLEQLPIGLFSDHVNYDRQNSYREMYDIVKAEFDKLNKDEQKNVSDALDKMGDDHETGSSEPSDEKGQDGKPQSGGPQDGEPQDGGPQDGEPSDDEFDQMDKNHKQNEEDLNKGKEISSEDEAKEEEKKKESKSGQGSGKGGSSGGRDGEGSKFDYSKIKPNFTWKKLLDKMVTDASNNSEETYQKPNRRNITGIDLARQTGAGAMKPGEVPLDNEIKLGFVVDSSGSMTNVIAKVYANMVSLLKMKAGVNASEFFLIKFSNQHHIFKCNYKKNKYRELNSVFEKGAKNEKSGSVSELFSRHIGDGTSFTAALADQVSQLATKKYNILIMSDSDIMWGNNFEHISKVVLGFKNVFVILDSRATFVQFCQQIKQIPRNVTYFE